MASLWIISLLILASVACFVLAADPDIHRPCPELITSKGYPLEVHNITTEDGYILTTFRIPHGKLAPVAVNGPVILGHGVLDSSNTWVNNLENESLGFILADAGFDVWLMNVRGNMYGMNHIHLTPQDAAFWNFTWDDMGMYDVPANIDHVLSVTNSTKVGYVGHSQGTTQTFAMLSLLRPEHNSKLTTYIALAPVAHIGHTSSILLKALADLHADQIIALLGLKEFLPDPQLIDKLLPDICKPFPSLCEDVIGLIAGFDQSDYNVTRQPVYVSHFPTSTSVKNMIHWSQGVRTNKFERYDYGSAANNQLHYGQSTPPAYDVGKITAKIVIFAGDKDALADITDVKQLLKEVPPNTPFYENAQYAHLDFVWGMHANETIYSNVVTILASAHQFNGVPLIVV